MQESIEHLAHYIFTHEHVSLSAEPSWNLATGTAGLALLYEALVPTLSEHWHERAEHLLARTLALQMADPCASPENGLFTGLAGLCQVVTSFAALYPDYVPLQKQFYRQFYTSVQRQYRTFTPDTGISFRDYDVISGPAGILSVVLFSWLTSPSQAAEDVLTLLMERLLFLSQPNAHVPGHLRLFIAPEHAPYHTYAQRFPRGATDCGFAHGVSGVLAALALCALYYTPGRSDLAQTIYTLSSWLVAHCEETTDLVRWPLVVPRDAPAVFGESYFWCYGASGTAWALHLAGLALQEQRWQALAIRTMKTLYRTLLKQHEPLCPLLCHGLAGMLQVVHGFACSTGEPFFASFQDLLRQRLQAQFDATLPSGFWSHQAACEPLTSPFFLSGVAGIACALLPLEAQKRLLFPFFLLCQPPLRPLL